MPESFYQSTPYYRELIKEHLQNLIKAGHSKNLPGGFKCLQFLKEQGYEIAHEDETWLLEWYEHLTNFAKVHQHLKDCQTNNHMSGVEEIIVHNPSWVQVIGTQRLEFFGEALSKDDYEFSLLLFAQRHGLLWNQASPFLCFQTELFGKDWRVTLIHKSLCDHLSSKVFFRHHAKEEFSLESFGLTEGQQTLIQQSLSQKKNILVCGATGSGKTSFLKSLVTLIPEREHLITLEDTPELRPKSPFATQLITPNDGPQNLKKFCHYALRMRPDRMILGEIRSAEVVPFLLSINTGHGGMMSSLHANSALDALHRLCLLFQVYSQQMNVSYHDVMKLVCQGIDFVVFLEHKRITSIVEVKGCEGTTPYYEMWN